MKRAFSLLALAVSCVGTNPLSQAFEYDEVGNLIAKTFDGVRTDFFHDANDRLDRSEILGVVTSDYAWNANGELVSRDEGGVVTDYAWDVPGRLIRVSQGAADRITKSRPI